LGGNYARQNKPVPPPRQPIDWEVSTKLTIDSDLNANASRRFWKMESGPQPKPSGRPSSRDLVRAEAQRRLDSGLVPSTLKEFGNKLSEWLRDNHPDAPPMAGPTVEDNIRDLFSAR
jgi:hypothetical protein